MTNTPPLPTLRPEAKHGLAGEVIKTLQPHNEGCEATLLVEYLTLFGGMLGLTAHFYIGRTPHYARLFTAVVGQSGTSRKGSTFNLVKSVFDLIDPKFLRANIRKNVGSDAGIITAAIQSVEYAQQTGRDDGRLILVENEFVTLLTGGTLQRTSPMIRDAWDVNALQSTVKRSRIADPIHLSIIGMITLDEMQHLLPNPRVQAQISNGLFNRFLMILAQGSKQLHLDQMEVPEQLVVKLAVETEDALRFGWQQGAVPVERGVKDAQLQWRQKMQQRREKEVARARIAGRMFDLLNRGETYLLRLALIYAVLDGSPVIKFDHYMAAEALWDYVEGSVRYIFEIPEFSSQAQTLLAAITTAGPAGLTKTEMRAVLSNNHEYFNEAFRELADSGRITETKFKNGKKGRPQTVVTLVEFVEMAGVADDLALSIQTAESGDLEGAP